MEWKFIKGILSFEVIYQNETDSHHKELEVFTNGEWSKLYDLLDGFIDKEVTILIK